MMNLITKKVFLSIVLLFFMTLSYGQKPVRFALFNNSDNEIKVITSPIIQFKEFEELVQTSIQLPKYQGDTGSLRFNGIFYQITRMNMRVLQHQINNPDTGIYILKPKSALLIGYAVSNKNSLSLDDILINYLKFYTPKDTIVANDKAEIWLLKDREKFKFQSNSTIFKPSRPIFAYSIYIH